jgi:hypothetical protein
MEKTLNIYQKLLTIQQKVSGLGKDKKGNNFEYVTGNKVLEHIKPLMNELGLILKIEVLSIDNVRQDYLTRNGSKSEINSKVMMRFTWVDTATGERDENLFGANGQNDWDKGVGSALTYGERYFLLKYFHIATDEDDIDNPDLRKSEPVKLPEPPKLETPKVDLKALETSALDELKKCKTLAELKTTYDSFTTIQKNIQTVITEKNKLKTTLK